MTQAGNSVLPRWRGFNLLEMFGPKSQGDFSEDDFRWMSDWGFDFARIPMCYLLWVDGDWRHMRESTMEKVDRVVDFGAKYRIHVDLNFHRAPGYCVAPEPVEPFNLWKDQEAQDAFCFHWQMFARRYKGIDSGKLSFNLVNEPPGPNEKTMTRQDHERVVRRAVSAIRAIDPDRLIMADGLQWGNEPNPELADLGVGQSCRAYYPFGVSHYQAEWTFAWMDRTKVPRPAWPGGWHTDGRMWTRDDLERLYRPWLALAASGVGVHCGEGGAYRYTPHDVVLRWFEDVLQILKSGNIGWALWNFRGSFGVLDSTRADVHYKDWHGHALDEEFLRLLQKY